MPVAPDPSSPAPSLLASVRAILAAADADIAARKPICQASGRCCKFEQYGHRLYVTAAELAHFAASLPLFQPPAPPGGHRIDASIHSIDVRQSEIERAANPPAVSLPQFFAQPGGGEGCPYQIDGLCTAREARPLGCRIYFCDQNAQSWQAEVYEKYHAQLQALHETHALPYRYMEWRAALKELQPPRP